MTVFSQVSPCALAGAGQVLYWNLIASLTRTTCRVQTQSFPHPVELKPVIGHIKIPKQQRYSHPPNLEMIQTHWPVVQSTKTRKHLTTKQVMN
jgi:hypothetical protein